MNMIKTELNFAVLDDIISQFQAGVVSGIWQPGARGSEMANSGHTPCICLKQVLAIRANACDSPIVPPLVLGEILCKSSQEKSVPAIAGERHITLIASYFLRKV